MAHAQMEEMLLSVNESRALLGRVDDVLSLATVRLGRILIAGPLNDAQQTHLHSACDIIGGLQDLFKAESDRLAQMEK